MMRTFIHPKTGRKRELALSEKHAAEYGWVLEEKSEFQKAPKAEPKSEPKAEVEQPEPKDEVKEQPKAEPKQEDKPKPATRGRKRKID